MPQTQLFQISHHGRTVYGKTHNPNEASFPIVIFSHGYNGYQDDFLPEIDCLTKNGIGALSFTFCGCGARDTSGFPTTEMTLFTERDDLLAVVEYAKTLKGFNGELYLYGGSQGGIVSALATEVCAKDIQALFLLFPAFCIPENWGSQFKTEQEIPDTYPLWGVTLGKKYFQTILNLDVYASMKTFEKPVLIFHGTEDDVVPISFSERAVKAYPNATLFVYKGEAHGFSPSAVHDVASHVVAFCKKKKD